MKAIKILFLFIITLLFSSNNYAQVSGFLGKKNIISGSLFMKSSFWLPNKNGNSGYLSFNDHYSLEYERVISRRNSVKLHFTTFESKYGFIGENIDDRINVNTLSSKALGADFIIYHYNSIAPLGVYISGGFDVFFNKAYIDTATTNKHNYVNIYDLNRHIFLFDQLNTVNVGINIKSGVKQIFFNCISFDVNFQLGAILAKPIITDFGSGIEWEDQAVSSEDYIKSMISSRLWGHYLWGVNCSIGYVF